MESLQVAHVEARPRVVIPPSSSSSPRVHLSPRLLRPGTAPSNGRPVPHVPHSVSSSHDAATVQRWTAEPRVDDESLPSERENKSYLETLAARAADLASELYRLKLVGGMDLTGKVSSPRMHARIAPHKKSIAGRSKKSGSARGVAAAEPTTCAPAEATARAVSYEEPSNPFFLSRISAAEDLPNMGEEHSNAPIDPTGYGQGLVHAMTQELEVEKEKRVAHLQQLGVKRLRSQAIARAWSAWHSTWIEMTKARQEAALEESRSELANATHLCERQRLELESLRGRGAAVKVASAYAVHTGTPWSQEDELRFHALAKMGDEGKHSDGLRELLDLAVAATTARVSDALREAAHARAVSERADRESLQVMTTDDY